MTVPSNGITADLLNVTFAVLLPSQHDETAAWRQARIMRLTREMVALKPVNTGQAPTGELGRDAAQRGRARVGSAPALGRLSGRRRDPLNYDKISIQRGNGARSTLVHGSSDAVCRNRWLALAWPGQRR
jgi:hypothetical protein